MKDPITFAHKNAAQIEAVVNTLVQHMKPQKVLLFSQKTGLRGELSSFKLCLIMPTEHKNKDIAQTYLLVDSPVPFDVLMYTPTEWQTLILEHDSFARKINDMGEVLYE